MINALVESLSKDSSGGLTCYNISLKTFNYILKNILGVISLSSNTGNFILSSY